MSGRLYLSPMPNSHRWIQGDGRPPRNAYVLAATEHGAEVRRMLAQAFEEIVNTVVSNVFVVCTDLGAADMQSIIRDLASRQSLDVEIVFAVEPDWQAMSRQPQPSAAVA